MRDSLRLTDGSLSYHPSVSSLVDSFFDVPDRNRYCAVDDNIQLSKYGQSGIWITAPAADVHRWLSATHELVQTVRALKEEANSIRNGLYPPPRARGLRRTFWKLARTGQHKRRLAEYQATWQRLHEELQAAYRTHDERSAGLHELVRAEQERQKREEERQQEQKRLEELQRREERAAALGGPDDRAWSCRVGENRKREFRIWLSSLDDDFEASLARGMPPLLSDVTAREIQAELVRERAEHPFTTVRWGFDTGQAMRERQGDDLRGEVTTWEELTGERIETYPRQPGDRRSSRHGTYGPSSTYGSDFGGGYDGGSYGGYGGSF